MIAPDFEVIDGDVRQVLDLLPPDSVHLVVTSVPYWKLRKYADSSSEAAFEIGSEPTFDLWLETMVDVFERVKRVLRPDGTVWLNTGDSYNTNEHGPNGRSRLNRFSSGTQYKKGTGRGRVANLKHKDMIGQPWSLAFALRDAGWWLRSEIIWSKVNPLPEHFDRPAKAHEQIFVLSKSDRCYGEEDFDHEHFFLLSKSDRYFYDKLAVREPASENTHTRGANRTPKAATADPDTTLSAHFMFAGVSKTRNCRTVWAFPTRGAAKGSDHHATFPLELPERCIRAGTSERGVCASCGAPWLRETTKASGGSIGKSWHPHENDEVTGNAKCSTKGYEPPRTIGWLPSCACGAPAIPATVLDPFSGTGTSGEASLKLGRSYVGIELVSKTATFSRERLARAAEEFAAPIFEHPSAPAEQRALFQENAHE